MVYATASIAFLSFIVWAHHMFTVGMPLAGQLFFMLSTMLIAIPTGVKVFNWTATMYKGSAALSRRCCSLSFLFLATIGGLSGLMLAIDTFQYQDTYFVVAHFHYVLVPGAIFAIMGAVYYWLPKWTGNMYDQTLVMAFLAVDHFRQRAVLPTALPGSEHAAPGSGYAVQFTDWNMVSSIGGFAWPVAVPVSLHHLEVRARRASAIVPGRSPWPGWELPSPRRSTPGRITAVRMR